jgi:hypothetical protein
LSVGGWWRTTCLIVVLPAAVATAWAREGGSSPSTEERPWEALREGRHDVVMEAWPALESGDRARRLGRALAELNLEPRTALHLEQAAGELSGLAAERDDVGVAARYFLARIAERHAFVPDPELAAERYRRLIEEFPDHPLAQAAVAKLALLEIYALSGDPLATLAELESWAGRLTSQGAKRDYHLVMARSYLFFEGDRARALVHLKALAETGLRSRHVKADTLVTAGELARDAGDNGVASAFYREFLERFPRDVRQTLVRERLARVDDVRGGQN